MHAVSTKAQMYRIVLELSTVIRAVKNRQAMDHNRLVGQAVDIIHVALAKAAIIVVNAKPWDRLVARGLAL